MNTHRLSRLAAATVLALATAGVHSGTASAAIVTTASGVYDEQTTQANAVDQTATSPTSGTVSLVSLATFKTDIVTAFAAGNGGVINFDDAATVSSETSIGAKYGPSNSRTLTLTGTAYQVDMGSLSAINATPISGNTYLRNGSATGNQSFTFSESILEVGVTVLARSVSRTITATVTYNDGTTGSIGPFTVNAATGTAPNTASTPDTFFGFAAPTGKRITNLTLAAGADNFFVVDDIGFVVPEPGTASVAAVAGLGLLARRRRVAR